MNLHNLGFPNRTLVEPPMSEEAKQELERLFKEDLEREFQGRIEATVMNMFGYNDTSALDSDVNRVSSQ